MDSDPWVIPLAAAALGDDQRIGGKAAQLARLHRAGFRIAPGFCVTVAAYRAVPPGHAIAARHPDGTRPEAV